MLYYSGRGGYGYRRYYKRSDPAKYEKAAEMRNNPTEAEAAMWDILRDQVYQNFPNYIFYRQSVQYGYILDFYCPRLRLGVEVDGIVHDNDERKEYDYYRDNLLARHGIEVHRYNNDEVLYRPQETAAKVFSTLKYKNDHPEIGVVQHEGCFIATAAFGTPMAQEINVLRRFRDLKMKTNLIGRQLIHLYYTLSPPLARVIARSKNMKTFVRLSLKPLIRSLTTFPHQKATKNKESKDSN
jgi:very-short-patch-repair endonuclease